MLSTKSPVVLVYCDGDMTRCRRTLLWALQNFTLNKCWSQRGSRENDVTEPSQSSPRKWYKRVSVWVIGTVLAAFAAFITGTIVRFLEVGAEKIGEPMTVVARRVADCPFSYVIPSASPRDIPPPPSIEFDPALRDKWATDLGGVDGGNTLVELAIIGKSGRAVVLQELKVEVLSRNNPLQGTEVHAVCGDALQARYMTVNLDKKPPVIEAAADYRYLSDPSIPEEPIRFPYTTSESDPEVFYVIALTDQCDCTWRIKLRWIADGDSGEKVIDNNGQPFRTTATINAPSYTSNMGEPINK